jgi:hypothetical protein
VCVCVCVHVFDCLCVCGCAVCAVGARPSASSCFCASCCVLVRDTSLTLYVCSLSLFLSLCSHHSPLVGSHSNRPYHAQVSSSSPLHLINDQQPVIIIQSTPFTIQTSAISLSIKTIQSSTFTHYHSFVITQFSSSNHQHSIIISQSTARLFLPLSNIYHQSTINTHHPS